MKLFIEAEDGLSAGVLQRALGMSRYESSYQVLHRLRLATAEIGPSNFGENSEVSVELLDIHNQTVIVALNLENGKVRVRDLGHASISTVESFFLKFISASAVVLSDEISVLEGAELAGHNTEKPVADEREAMGLLLDELTRWLSLPSQRNNSKHLRPLLNEFAFRQKYWRRDNEAFEMLLDNAVLRSAPHAKQIYSGRWVHTPIVASALALDPSSNGRQRLEFSCKAHEACGECTSLSAKTGKTHLLFFQSLE